MVKLGREVSREKGEKRKLTGLCNVKKRANFLMGVKHQLDQTLANGWHKTYYFDGEKRVSGFVIQYTVKKQRYENKYYCLHVVVEFCKGTYAANIRNI